MTAREHLIHTLQGIPKPAFEVCQELRLAGFPMSESAATARIRDLRNKYGIDYKCEKQGKYFVYWIPCEPQQLELLEVA